MRRLKQICTTDTQAACRTVWLAGWRWLQPIGKGRKEAFSRMPMPILTQREKYGVVVVGKCKVGLYGFRKGRSCTTALATAHAAWVSAKAKGKVVAVVGFDLSAASDTVGREDLLPKMLAMGIGGKTLKWFRCFLTNVKQHVVWDGQVSDVVDVEYGVRQGSLLGPVLYQLHVSDLPLAMEIRETNRGQRLRR
jgi:hypothetical protein